MNRTSINESSTIMESYEHFQSNHDHADNTKVSYNSNALSFQVFMEENEIEPLIKNINFELAQAWLTGQYKTGYAGTTIKSRVGFLKSLNSYLVNLGILQSNIFKEIDKGIIIEEDNHHSKVLSLSELYEVYKAAFELDELGKNVLISTLIAMFTGVRNTSLVDLKVKSISKEMGIIFKYEGKRKNTKNKDYRLPLPPKLLALLINYIEDKELEPEDSLLYGLRGTPLANKQFNAVVNQLCLTLGWTKVRDLEANETKEDLDENSTIKGKKVFTNTEKHFTPHGFRYTIATVFSEMGIKDASIRFLLNHSEFEKGNLKSYIISDKTYSKEVKIGQLILETLLDTAYELEKTNNIILDIERVKHDLPTVLDRAKRDFNEITIFRSYLISMGMEQAKQKFSGNEEGLLYFPNYNQFTQQQMMSAQFQAASNTLNHSYQNNFNYHSHSNMASHSGMQSVYN